MSFWNKIVGTPDAETVAATEKSDAAVKVRREAMAALAVGATGALVALATGAQAAPEAKAEPAADPTGKPMPPQVKHKWGMAIDLDRCTGCGGCVVACQTENNVPSPGPEASEASRGIYWMDLLTTTEGSFPDLNSQVIPTPCMQCDDPPCVKVCPVGATSLNDEGIVVQIWDRCIGCRYCMVSCPYQRRYFNWSEPQWTGVEHQALNPDVATRPDGVVEKCTFCQQRVRAVKEQARSEERPLTDADVRHLPACAQSCSTQAITFGDLNDPHSEVSQLHKSSRAVRLLEELGAKPKVVYLRAKKFEE